MNANKQASVKEQKSSNSALSSDCVSETEEDSNVNSMDSEVSSHMYHAIKCLKIFKWFCFVYIMFPPRHYNITKEYQDGTGWR